MTIGAMISGLLLVALAFAAGVAFGRRRQAPAPDAPPDDHPLRINDAMLHWFGAAHEAVGTWLMEKGGVAVRCHLEAALPAGEILTVERRLLTFASVEGDGVEHLDSGTLLLHARRGSVAGMLLPETPKPQLLDRMREDMRELLVGLWQGASAPEPGAELPLQTLASICQDLANRLEHLAGSGCFVAVLLRSGVRVLGTSRSTDSRLVDVQVAKASPVDRVAQGAVPSLITRDNPVGEVVADRRERREFTHLFPIQHEGVIVGVAALAQLHDRELSGPVYAQLSAALREAGPRLANGRHVWELKRSAVTDPLTGLANRRGLEDAMGRFGLTGGALVYADLDRFKSLNDTLGHPAGDEALKHFARILKNQIRPTDLAARIGGEEFALWLPGAALNLAVGIAERIREQFASREWAWRGTPWELSASFGVACWPELTRSRENLAALADAALYRAKEEGRNRVVTATVGGEA